MPAETMVHAQRIWDYLASYHCQGESDAIVVCCSYDLRVCDYACDLVLQGVAPIILFSGKTGNWTNQLWEESEAHVFADRARKRGVPEHAILIEDQATNLGENIAFAKNKLAYAKTVTFVTKPNTILRVRLSIPKQWPGIQAYTACPPFAFPDEVSHIVGVFGVIHEMVGDLERIQNYPGLGFQEPHAVPDVIWESWHYLVDQGFTLHRMK